MEFSKFVLSFVSRLVPGKPPQNVTSKPLSPSAISVTWEIPRSNHCEVFPLQGFRIFYSLQTNLTNIRFVDVKSPSNHIVIQNLENFENYLLWVQTITPRGLGPKSTAALTRTLEKGERAKKLFYKKFSHNISSHFCIVVRLASCGPSFPNLDTGRIKIFCCVGFK